MIKIPTQTIRLLSVVNFRGKLTDTSITLLNCLKKRLRGHPNIVQFYSAASLSEKETEHGMSEFLILTELCSGKMCLSLLLENSSPFFCQLLVFAFSYIIQLVHVFSVILGSFEVSDKSCLIANLDCAQMSN